MQEEAETQEGAETTMATKRKDEAPIADYPAVTETRTVVAECWTCRDNAGRPSVYDNDPWLILALQNHLAAGHDVREVTHV